MCPTPDSTLADPQEINADLQRQLAECRAARDEALARETAMADVLRVINSSPGDLASVFDAMLDRALRLCEASFGNVVTYDGERIDTAAHRGVSSAYREFLLTGPREPGPHGLIASFLGGAAFVHIDAASSEPYRAGNASARAIVDLEGGRSVVAVPLRKEQALLGYIVIYRREVRPFTDKQIALLQNFAAQAVIAMENARLITETREALEQQTATAEVLQVINSSPGDLAPVFDAILEKAHSLCGAAAGALLVCEGEEYHRVAAVHGATRLAEYWPQGSRQPLPPRDEDSPARHLMRGERFIHLPDATADSSYHAYERYRNLIDVAGARTLLVVPLRRMAQCSA